MIIPKNETRRFKTGVLQNMIKYCLIENNNIDKTHVCVVVGVGSAMDPQDNNGLAHFLEHMLFMGNKKYPEEDFFDNHLKKYGGYSNAYTSTFETVYFFESNNDGVDIACDCFSEFFKSPLFKEDMVNREINAINSEHMKNIDNDFFRIRHFMFKNSRDKSILNKFYTGNLESFNKNVRNDMIKLWKNYYRSENLTICIQSNKKIIEQESFLKPFKSIPLKKKELNQFSIMKPLYDENNMIHYLESFNDIKRMVLYYEIDYGSEYYKDLTPNIFCDFINMNCMENLKTILIINKLVSNLYAFTLDEGFMVFYIDLYDTDDITISKIKKYLDSYFKYMMNYENWDDFINYSRIKYKIFFDNSENDNSIDITNSIATNLYRYQDYNKHFYSAESLILEDNMIIKNKLNKIMSSYSNCNILIYSNDKMKIMHGFDKFYKMKYSKNLNNNLNNILKNSNLKNINFNVVVPKIKQPKLLKTCNMKKPKKDGNIFFITNYNFKEPIVYCKFIYFINENIDVDMMVSLMLYVKYINEIVDLKMNSYIDLGSNINLSYNIFSKNLVISISGFNNLFIEILSELKKILNTKKIDNNIFSKVKKNLLDGIITKKTNTPWNIVDYYIKNNYFNNIYSFENVIKSINSKNKKLINIDLNNFEYNVYLGGNLSDSMISYIISRYKKDYNIIIEDKSIELKNMINIKKNPKNTFLSYNFDIGKYEAKKNTLLLLFVNMMSSKFFNIFRTKKQYGYLVNLTSSIINFSNSRNYLLSMKVQTEKDVNILKKDMDDYIKNIKEFIKEIDVKPFIDNLLIQLNENPKNTSELFSKYYMEIINKTYNFNKTNQYLENLKKINKKDIYNFIDMYINSNKVIIHHLSY